MKQFQFLGLALFLMMPFLTLAQKSSNGIDQRLNAKYSVEYLNNLKSQDPAALDYLNYFVENVYRIIDMPDKQIVCLDLMRVDVANNQPITLAEMKNFNFYNYNCTILPDKRMFYKIKNTGKLLIIVSEKDLKDSFSNYQRLNENNK